MEMPKHARDALAALAAAEQIRRDYEDRQDRHARRQRERERRERREALPAAERVVAWARAFAAHATAAELPDGPEIYRTHGMSVSVTKEGALRVRHWSKFGHGVTHPPTTSPAMLVKHAHAGHVRLIAERIESGGIWDDIAEHAGRATRELDDLDRRRRPWREA
jgi:hypothetical protein